MLRAIPIRRPAEEPLLAGRAALAARAEIGLLGRRRSCFPAPKSIENVAATKDLRLHPCWAAEFSDSLLGYTGIVLFAHLPCSSAFGRLWRGPIALDRLGGAGLGNNSTAWGAFGRSCRGPRRRQS